MQIFRQNKDWFQLYCIFLSILIKLGMTYRDAGYPNSITCFTCTNSSSNRECDRLAVDRACRVGEDVCQTEHVMAVHGGLRVGEELSRNSSQLITHSVRKKCSDLSQCLLTAGCRWEGLRKVCQSCCSGSYCNEGVPWGEEDLRPEELRSSSVKSGNSGRYLPIFVFIFKVI